MPTTIPTPRFERRRRSRGFTLVELLVASGLSAIVLASVLSAVLMISRSGYLLNNYIEMEKQARNALETFAVDARVTQSIAWNRASTTDPLIGIALTNPDGESITYTYDSDAGTLSRVGADGQVRVLVSGIQSLTFTAYKYTQPGTHTVIDPTITPTASLDKETKMVQISLSAVRSRSTLVDATNNVVSARYVLRNKIQTT